MKSAVLLAVGGLFAVVTPALAEIVTYDASLVSPDNGSGNVGVQGGWTVATGNGIELGLSAILRQVNGVIDSPNGVYFVPSGIQVHPPALVTNPAADAWNFQFSIDLNPGGNTTSLTFSQVTASLQITNLNTLATVTVDPTLAPDDSGFGTANGTTLANRTVGVMGFEWGAQNSENPLQLSGFFPSLNYDLNAADTFAAGFTVLALLRRTDLKRILK